MLKIKKYQKLLLHLGIWLILIIAVTLGLNAYYYRLPKTLMYASEPYQTSAGMTEDGFAYLNRIRQTVGIRSFTFSKPLSIAASRHVRYLQHYPNDGHQQKRSSSPYFSGTTPAIRTAGAGYPYQNIHENIGLGYRSQTEAVNGLLTSLYHRISLLDPMTDEAGSAWVPIEEGGIFVINQGRMEGRLLCEAGRRAQLHRRFYGNLCSNQAVIYPEELSEEHWPDYITYPVGEEAEILFDGNEKPNPVPQYDYTGNPISIVFNPHQAPIELVDFSLYQGYQKINDTHLLTQANDGNNQGRNPQGLNAFQFALFPLEPLRYNTKYRVKVAYRQNDEVKNVVWDFRTRRPELPYFIAKDDDQLAVSDNRSYFLTWDGFFCKKDCPVLDYRAKGAFMNILSYGLTGITFRVTGRKGGHIHMQLKTNPPRTADIYLTTDIQ